MRNPDLPGEALSSINRSVGMADRVFLSWLGFRRTGRPAPMQSPQFYETMIVTDDGALHHVVAGAVRRTISRGDLPRLLTTTEMEAVSSAEVEMDALVGEWERLTSDPAAITRTSLARLDQIANGITAHIRRITDLLAGLGFELSDHYERMRQIAQS